ncbi:hypothetical protein BOTBODRAFT_90617, partial [Botryobasidium botryosum FD-172 SS1]
RRWTNPAIREAMVDYFRLQRAKEEIARLNIEVRRLRTWIDDEDLHYQHVVKALQTSDPNLAAEVESQGVVRAKFNAWHRHVLQAIENLAGFSGVHGRGSR